MFDLAIKNGFIVDGSGQKGYHSNLYITDGIIKTISTEKFDAKETLDAYGLTVAPGFIDMHTHSDLSCHYDRNMESKIFQGVTTELTGNCGTSFFPYKINQLNTNQKSMCSMMASSTSIQTSFSSYKTMTDSMPKTAINWCGLIGHGTLRKYVMGDNNRSSSPEEIFEMCQTLHKNLKEGAFGMSLGLIYPPSCYAQREELLELAKIIKTQDKILAVHLRSEREGIWDALEEMISIAEESQVHLHISHVKLAGQKQWEQFSHFKQRIDVAKKSGLNISMDQYPYNASSTSLTALLPKWALSGGLEGFLDILITNRDVILKEIDQIINSRGGPESVFIASTYGVKPEFEKKFLSEIIQESPADTVLRLLIACKGKVSAIYHSMSCDDVIEILSQKDIAVASDGTSLKLDSSTSQSSPHPRNFATFPRALKLIRDHKLMSLEDAIYKMTGLPARLIQLKDRGMIKESYVADLTLFNYDQLDDHATFNNPIAQPIGVEHVIVSGKITVKNGKHQNVHNGQVLHSR